MGFFDRFKLALTNGKDIVGQVVDVTTVKDIENGNINSIQTTATSNDPSIATSDVTTGNIIIVNEDSGESYKLSPKGVWKKHIVSNYDLDQRLKKLTELTNNLVTTIGPSGSYLRNLPQQVSYTAGAEFGDFTNWYKPTTVEEIGTISNGISWADRSDFDKEWLTAMGLAGNMYFAPDSFKVYRLTAPKDRSGHSFPYLQVPVDNNNYITYAAFVKYIQGEVPYGWWCQGLQATNKIQLCGGHITGAGGHYTHSHPYKVAGTVDTIIEVALAGTVDAYIPLDNVNNWWSVAGLART